ncbi:MAG: hypothetical protein AAB460_00030 [Patescibacteria group bacterium]
MSKTFYIAARPSKRRDLVDEIANLLQARGWQNAFDWVAHEKDGNIPRPYASCPDKSYESSNTMLRAAATCDLFILIYDDDLVGANMEYGVARYTLLTQKGKRIVVLHGGERDNLFIHGPNISHVENPEALQEWIVTKC